MCPEQREAFWKAADAKNKINPAYNLPWAPLAFPMHPDWGGEPETATVRKMNYIKNGNLLYMNYNMTLGDDRVPGELWFKIMCPPPMTKASLSCEMASTSYFARMEGVQKGISLSADARAVLQWLLGRKAKEDRINPVDIKKVDQAWGKLDPAQRERCERVMCYLLALVEDESEKKGIGHAVYMGWSAWAQVMEWEHYQVILLSHSYIWHGTPMPDEHPAGYKARDKNDQGRPVGSSLFGFAQTWKNLSRRRKSSTNCFSQWWDVYQNVKGS
jgi:hypothetical protein